MPSAFAPSRYHEYHYLRHHANIPSFKQSQVSHRSVETPQSLFCNHEIIQSDKFFCYNVYASLFHFFIIYWWKTIQDQWVPRALAECRCLLWECPEVTRLLLTAIFSYFSDGLARVKGWTLKLVVLHFPLVAPGACTTMVVSLPEARFQESLSWWGMTQKRLVSISKMSLICKEMFSVTLQIEIQYKRPGTKALSEWDTRRVIK